MSEDQAIATLVAAIIAAIAAVGGALVNFWNASQTRNREALSEIATHRVNWMGEVRTQSARLITICNEINSDQEPDKRFADFSSEVSLSIEHLKLLLNPDENGHLYLLVDGLALSAAKHNLEQYNLNAVDFRHSIRLALSDEWQKAKSEMRGKAA